MKALLIIVLVSIGFNSFAEEVEVTPMPGIVIRPLEVLSESVAEQVFGGAVISGTASWVKVASVSPEDTTYRIHLRAYFTTENHFLNDPKVIEEKVTKWPPGKMPTPEEMGMNIVVELKMLDFLEVSRCSEGRVLLVFKWGRLIKQQTSCQVAEVIDMPISNN
jgi:hypothetical protein